MRSLLLKTLYDKRSFIIGWSLGLIVIGYFMTIFYPAFHDDSGLDQLVKSLPTAFQGLVGDLGNLKQLSSYIASQLFDIRMPIFISILSILLAVGLTVGEEDKGQLRTLSALPLSRASILLQKWLAIVIICVISTFAVVVGVELGIVAINQSLDQLVLVRLGLMTLLLAVALATFIFSVGLATGKRSITTALGVIVAVGSFILSTFARAVDWLGGYEKLSIFHYFPATDIASGTIDLKNILVYVGIIVISLLIALVAFRKRDIH